MATLQGPRTFQPKDRTKREHVGRVERVVWSSDDDTRVILALADGSKVIGDGARGQFLLNQQYRFLGRWQDGQRGTDFHFDTFTVDQPHFSAGVVKYLSDVCRGVGQKTALALWDEFGPDGVRTLREEPAKVVAAGIMSEAAAALAVEDLQKYAHIEKTRVDLFGLFAGRGFPGRLIEAAISRYGVAAPDFVRLSPYRLMIDRLPGCSFRRCDRLYLDGGGRPTALKRQALAGWNAFREDRTGSTWLDAKDCVETIQRLVPPPDSDPIKALRLLIRGGWVRIRRDGRERYIALRDKADAESRVAAHVRRLRRAAVRWPTDIPVSRAEGDRLPSPHQAAQLRAATASAVGAFTGGPGTGKTHSVAYLLRLVIQHYGRDSVCVCAPTGKAAVRAGEAMRNVGVDIRATTIHQLLEIGRNGHDGDGWGFARREGNPLDCRFVFVEEPSMIDTTLMADLLGACADGTHVLLTGDPYQLPPVGHGAPLRDLLAGGLPAGQLTEVRRNSGAVVRACDAIKAGRPVEMFRAFDLEAEDPANLKHIECTQQQVPLVLEDVLRAITRFDRVWETQVITGLNDKSDSSRRKINDRVGGLLNPDGRGVKGNPFKVGDKVICRRNQRLKTYAATVPTLPPGMAGDADNYMAAPFDFAGVRVAEWYVANGEIGRVVAVSAKGTVIRFGGAEVPLVWVATAKRRPGEGDDGTADGGKEDFEPAWAITVHGSQGSEWPLVICLVDDAASGIADRNYWYTAISRARKGCVVIGPRGVFDRQARKVSIDRRRTFLAEQLKEPVEPGEDQA